MTGGLKTSILKLRIADAHLIDLEVKLLMLEDSEADAARVELRKWTRERQMAIDDLVFHALAPDALKD